MRVGEARPIRLRVLPSRLDSSVELDNSGSQFAEVRQFTFALLDMRHSRQRLETAMGTVLLWQEL